MRIICCLYTYVSSVNRLVDARSFAFVVARALVTEIKKLQQGSSNGQLQPDDLLNFFSGSHVEVYHPELHSYEMILRCLSLLCRGSVTIVNGLEEL